MGQRARMRRRREEDEELLEEERREAEPARAATLEDRTIQLQKTAGNRAVGAAIQRWAGPALWMAAQRQWPKSSQLIIDGQVVPLESVHEAVKGSGSVAVGTGGKGPEASKDAGEIDVVIPHGDWVAKLSEAANSGKHYKTVEVVIVNNGKGVRFTLTDVLVSNISFDSRAGDEPRMSIQLSFQKRDFSTSPPPPPAQR